MSRKSIGLHARVEPLHLISRIIDGRIRTGVRFAGRSVEEWVDEHGKEKLGEQVEAAANAAAAEILKFYRVIPKKYE